MKYRKHLLVTATAFLLAIGGLGCSSGNPSNNGNNGNLPPSPPAGPGGVPNQTEINNGVIVFAGAEGIGEQIHANPPTDCNAMDALLSAIKIDCDNPPDGTGSVVTLNNCSASGSVLTQTVSVNFNNCLQGNITQTGDATVVISFDSSNGNNPVSMTVSSDIMNVDGFTFATNDFAIIETEDPNPGSSACLGTLVYNNTSCDVVDCASCD